MKKIVCLFVCLFAGSVNATPISFFNNGSFVDLSNESPKLQSEIVSLGHAVTTFTDFSQSGFASAFSSSNLLVIPELESGDLFSAMSSSARSEVNNFVSSGGDLIIAGGYNNPVSFLNGIFGFSLVQETFTASGSTTLQLSGASGTPFADDPVTLGNNNGTTLVSGLPSGALDIYSSATGTSVFATDYGLGQIVFLGYDWFETPSPTTWNTVLDSAIQYTSSTTSVPEPTSLALLGLGLAGIGFSRKKKTT